VSLNLVHGNTTVCRLLMTSRWFSPGTLVSSTNKTDRHDITEILLKVALNTINQTKPFPVVIALLYIPASPAYGVYISQLIRYARASSNYSNFLKRHLHLRNRLLDQGYKTIHFKYFIDRSIGLDNRLCLYKSSPTTRWNNLNTIYIRHRAIYPSCIHAIHLNYQT
jgi:hypothetical protein